MTIGEYDTQVELDVTDHNIKMPKNGFFVAFEKLFIPYNKYGKNENDPLEEGFYSPVIGVTKSKRSKMKLHLQRKILNVLKRFELCSINHACDNFGTF